LEKLLLPFLLLIITITGSTQQSIDGVVKSESGVGIENGSIYFSDLNLIVITDSLGNFKLKSPIQLPVKIEVNALGYESKSLILDQQKSIIVLEKLHYHLNEVLVSIPKGKMQKQHITNVASRSMKEISYIPSNNIIEQIANIPGVDISSNGAGISKPNIRGLSGSRIVTLLNGLRIENQQWGGDHGTGITSVGIKGVEIIKGPASLLYGSDALGGIIYFTDLDFSNKTQGYVKSSFESNNLGINNEFGTQFSMKKLRVNLMGSQSSQADYQLPSGSFVKSSRFKDYNFKSALGYEFKNYNLSIRYNYLNSRIGIPGHSHEENANLNDYLTATQARENTIPAQLINNHYLLIDNKFYLDNSTLSIKLGQVSNHLREYDEKVTFAAINMLLNTTNYNIQYNKSLGSSSIILGAQGLFQQNKNLEASEQIIPSAQTIDNGVFILFNKPIKHWETQFGIRYDNKSLSIKEEFKGTENGSSKTFNVVNYSLGVSKKFKTTLFRANLSSGYRAPNSSELYANGIHHGAIRYEIGNSMLKSEQANQIDLSWEIQKEHLSLIINPYFNQINNYIFISPTDSVIDNKNVFQYEQANNAMLFGGEFGLHYHPHFAHHLHLETSFSYTEGRFDTDSYLPLIPQPKVNTLLKIEGSSKKKFKLDNISLQHLYYLPQNNLNLNETYSVDYHLINIGCNFKLDLKQELLIKLGVRNILNTRYINHLSQLKTLEIPNPGRNFYLGININIK
jgi:iron complex outermembrane receptor protein